MRDLGPMMTMSDLSQYNWRKLVCIQTLGEAVGDCGVSSSGNGFGGDVDLDIVSVAVKELRPQKRMMLPRASM